MACRPKVYVCYFLAFCSGLFRILSHFEQTDKHLCRPRQDDLSQLKHLSKLQELVREMIEDCPDFFPFVAEEAAALLSSPPPADSQRSSSSLPISSSLGMAASLSSPASSSSGPQMPARASSPSASTSPSLSSPAQVTLALPASGFSSLSKSSETVKGKNEEDDDEKHSKREIASLR